jgi:long-chain fatty acid transport protein
MKRSIKIAVAAALALSTTSAFATNGDHLIGMGAKSRGMGGIGIGMSHGAESGLSNPASITTVKDTQISFGGTVFMPDVETDMGTGGGSRKSDADISVIPEVAVAQKTSSGISWGIGMYGVAGMGVDYSDELNGFNNQATFNNAMAILLGGGTQAQAQGYVMGELAEGNFGMKTNLQLMQFSVPLAYKISSFSVGIAPVLQYGSLDIDYKLATFVDTDGNGAVDNIALTPGSTRGVAQDFGVGYNVGATFSQDGLTVGASYKSPIKMTYSGQISQAMADFTQTSAALYSDILEQPAEIGTGISYTIGGHTIAADYKRIKWSSAKGYKDFGWDDQDVYMLGYQYAQDTWAVRAGYNHADSAVVSNISPLINTFNLLGFPATVEDHYSIGGSYAFTKTTSIDLAYVYAASNTEQYANMLGSATTTKHSQDSVSMQLNFAF